MGLFDDVNFQCVCPGCGDMVAGFQSKDGPCEMGMVEVWDVRYLCAICESCGLRINVENIPTKTRIVITPGIYLGRDDIRPYPKQEESKAKLGIEEAK